MTTDASLRGRIAANTRWAHASAEDRARQGATAARGLRAKFEREVDPDGLLSPDERARRAASLLTAHMTASGEGVCGRTTEGRCVMSAHIEFRCDQCATSAPGAWGRYGIGPAAPKGWHYFDDKHFCGYGCIAVYAEHEAGVRNVAGLWNRSRPTDETER